MQFGDVSSSWWVDVHRSRNASCGRTRGIDRGSVLLELT